MRLMLDIVPPGGFTPRDGALAYYDEAAGCWRCCNPRDPAFSTVSMVATHYFDAGQWRAICSDGDGSDVD